MSFKLYSRGLIFSYASIGTNIAYSLVSVPIALSFLGKDGFGAWAVVLQIVLFLDFLDLGISHGIARLLIDVKGGASYGSALATGSAAQAMIGTAVLLFGVALAPFLPALVGVTGDLAFHFATVTALVSATAGLGTAARIYGGILYAHKRQDLISLSHLGLFLVYLATMLAGFSLGWGLYSMAFSYACGTLWSVIFAIVCVQRRSLAPPRNSWGPLSKSLFREMFAFGHRAFLLGLGWTILSGSPIFVISRTLGLDAAATWSVCLKPFQILMQLLSKPTDVATPFMAELYAQGEKNALRPKLQSLIQLTAALAAAGCVAVAALNPSFIALWTGGVISLPPLDHAALAGMVAVWALCRITSTFVGVSKCFGWMPFIYFIEAAVFVVLSSLLIGPYGMIAIPIAAIACHLLISFPFGIRLVRDEIGFTIPDFVSAISRPLIAAALLGIVAFFVTKQPFFAAPMADFLFKGSLLAIAGGCTILIALTQSLRSQIFSLVLKGPSLVR